MSLETAVGLINPLRQKSLLNRIISERIIFCMDGLWSPEGKKNPKPITWQLALGFTSSPCHSLHRIEAFPESFRIYPMKEHIDYGDEGEL